MKIELEDSDIARIAKAVAEIVGSAPKAEGSKAPTKAEKEAAAKAAAAAAAPEKQPDDAEAIQKRRGAVLAKVKALGEKIGRDEAKALINKYAPSMGEVKAADFDSLEADIDAASKAADKPKDAADDY